MKLKQHPHLSFLKIFRTKDPPIPVIIMVESRERHLLQSRTGHYWAVLPLERALVV